MAEFNSAEKLNIEAAEIESTDVMTGDRDKRMYLYYQLVNSIKKAATSFKNVRNSDDFGFFKLEGP